MEAVEHTDAPAGETGRELQGVFRYYELAKRAEWQLSRHALGRDPADPRVQRLAAEARPAEGPLALGDHPAAAGGRARRRDGDPALLDRPRPRGEALLHDDGAGRGAPHRGLAEADRGGGGDGRARPVPRRARPAGARRGHARGEGVHDAGLLRAPDHPAVPHDRPLVARARCSRISATGSRSTTASTTAPAWPTSACCSRAPAAA